MNAEKAFDKSPTLIHEKNGQQTRARREPPQTDQGHLPAILQLTSHPVVGD